MSRRTSQIERVDDENDLSTTDDEDPELLSLAVHQGSFTSTKNKGCTAEPDFDQFQQTHPTRETHSTLTLMQEDHQRESSAALPSRTPEVTLRSLQVMSTSRHVGLREDLNPDRPASNAKEPLKQFVAGLTPHLVGRDAAQRLAGSQSETVEGTDGISSANVVIRSHHHPQAMLPDAEINYRF